MKNKDLQNLLARAAAALETPKDLDAADSEDGSEDRWLAFLNNRADEEEKECSGA
jgi:hypothetical protein